MDDQQFNEKRREELAKEMADIIVMADKLKKKRKRIIQRFADYEEYNVITADERKLFETIVNLE